MPASKLTLSRLKEVMSYSPETGVFRWVAPTTVRVKIGDIVGSKKTNGYLKTCIDGEEFLLHRLAWFYCYGEWPKQQVDHKDCIRNNNAILNLRDISPRGNSENKKQAYKNNKSKLLGVSWNSRSSKWRVKIMVSRTSIHIGMFTDKIEAHEAYKKAKEELHKYK